MKKNHLIISIIVLAILVITTSLFFLFTRPKTTQVTPVSNVLVTPLNSEVFISFPITEILSPTRVSEGTRLITSATGRALIEGRHVAVLDTNTEITLTTHDTLHNKTALELHAGNLWNRVQKLSDQGEYYTVTTQNARASVRGTSFGMTKIDRMTILIVMEGSVLFGPTNGPFELVHAGEKAMVVDQDPVIISRITEQDTRDPWFVLNNPGLTIPLLPTINTSTSVTSTVSPTTIPTQIPTDISLDDTGEADTVVTTNNTNNEVSSVTSEPTTPVTTEPSPSPTAPTPEPTGTETQTQPVPAVELISVSPRRLTYGTSSTIVLTGKNFIIANATTLMVGKLQIKTFTKVDDTRIQFTLDTRLAGEGIHTVTLTDANGSSSSLSGSITVVSQATSTTTSTTTTTRR